MKPTSFAVTFTFHLICNSLSLAQGESAVPFLLIHPSPETNGWGNVGTAVISDNPIANIANPAQLGVFSLGNYFAASSYVGDRQWLPQFQQSDLTYSVWAMSAGYDISESIDLPFPIGIAVGYSRVDLNLGEFVITSSSGPDPIGTFSAFEKAEAVSIGVGIDYYVRLGLGMSFNNVVSSLSPVGTGQAMGPGKAEVSVTDFGLLLDVPVMDILGKINDERMAIAPNIFPLANISAGYAHRNHSNKGIVYYSNQADPLPRNVTIGLSVEAGIATIAGNQDWRLLTFSLAREAEDLLVVRNADGTSEYQSGLGDIAFFKHVIRGELSADERVNLHKGWQFNLAEIVYIRGGSFAESPNFGNRHFSTSGIGIHSSGVFKMIEALSPETLAGEVGAFIRDHLDIAYDRAEYTAPYNHPLSNTTFQSLTLVVR
ncbi:MAG: hypothetical protein ACKVRP_01040 [Bacteroidota bacterium]